MGRPAETRPQSGGQQPQPMTGEQLMRNMPPRRDGIVQSPVGDRGHTWPSDAPSGKIERSTHSGR